MKAKAYTSKAAAMRAAQALANRTGRAVHVCPVVANPRGPYPRKLAARYIAQEIRAGRRGKQAVAIGIARARARRGNPYWVRWRGGVIAGGPFATIGEAAADVRYWHRTPRPRGQVRVPLEIVEADTMRDAKRQTLAPLISVGGVKMNPRRRRR